MNLNRAFDGLRYGLQIAVEAKGDSDSFAKCQSLLHQAERDYKEGREDSGRAKLLELEALVKTLPIPSP
jgi:hypothetical protein